MPHFISAIVGKREHLEAVEQEISSAVKIDRAQNICLIPLVDTVVKDLLGLASNSNYAKSASFKPLIFTKSGNQFPRLDADLFAALHALSLKLAASKFGYIETAYIGGTGGQGALVWESGALVFPKTGAPEWGAGKINEALRILGVKAMGTLDEFDTIGLDAHRSTEAWLS